MNSSTKLQQMSNTVTVWEISLIIMRVTRKETNKYYSHSGIATNNRGGIGSKVISVRFSHHTNKVLLLWDSNPNSMESDNSSSNSKREK